jgi:hypothetical protein
MARRMRGPIATHHRALALVVSVIAAAGCNSGDSESSEVEGEVIPENVPVPAADAPKLFITRHRTPVRARPEVEADVLGDLGLGARIPRSDEPITKRGCEGGWFAIRPRGFVCAGADATVDDNHPVATHDLRPHRDRPMPYRYGRVTREAGVSYGAVPSAEQQSEAEPKLAKHKAPKLEQLGLGANDVPLTEDARPNGLPVMQPTGEGVGEDGRRTSKTWWSTLGGEPLEPGMSLLGPSAPPTRVLKRRSGVALTTTFDIEGRRFGLMADGRLFPTDRLTPTLGTEWHGADLREHGLPAAFALRSGVLAYELEKTKRATALDEDYEQGESVPISGRFRTVNRTRYYQTRDDSWVRHKDIIMAFKRNRFPDWATPEQKWLDISLANQTLVVWLGHKPLYATLISSGADRIGDPQTGPATMQGVFRLRSKHITRNVDDREVGQAHTVPEAPWVMEFHEGFSLTGCYWHDRFGEARSYHDVALAPIDAHWIWKWTEPEVPEGWHSVRIPEDAENNTIVYVHK